MGGIFKSLSISKIFGSPADFACSLKLCLSSGGEKELGDRVVSDRVLEME